MYVVIEAGLLFEDLQYLAWAVYCCKIEADLDTEVILPRVGRVHVH